MMMKVAYVRGVSRPLLKPCSSRNFSLLVPLQGKTTAPAEISNAPLTDRYFNQLKEEYAKFNAACQVEL